MDARALNRNQYAGGDHLSEVNGIRRGLVFEWVYLPGSLALVRSLHISISICCTVKTELSEVASDVFSESVFPLRASRRSGRQESVPRTRCILGGDCVLCLCCFEEACFWFLVLRQRLCSVHEQVPAVCIENCEERCA